MKKLLFTGLALSLSFAKTFSQSSVDYEIIFTSNWDNQETIPPNPHFSPLAVATHNENVTFFEMGVISTSGVQQIAEFGGTSIFENEVNSAISNNNADQVIRGSGVFLDNDNQGVIRINNISVSENFPLISILTMIAPSPDWIVGVNDLSLIDNNGAWKESITIDLFPYDAGTDSGAGYTSRNSVTNPKQPISSLRGVSPFNNEKMATLQINLKTVLSNEDFNFNEKLNFYPNPAKNEIKIIGAGNANLDTVKIFNVSGSLVKSIIVKKSLDTFNIDLHDLSAGLYLLKFIGHNGNSKTEKLTISH